MTRTSKHNSAANTRQVGAAVSARTKTVWVALASSMTAVAGLFSLLGPGPAGVRSGVTLTPLMSLGGASSVEAVFSTRADINPEQWQAIVIHDSGSPVGSAAEIDESHRARGFDGLGYHFLIGNGAGMADGEIHVGYRWLDQLPGAHVGGPEGELYNRVAVGICLVGDGDRRAFTPEQTRRVAQLVAALAARLGIAQDRVYLHSELAPVKSPGRLFPQAEFREQLRVLMRTSRG